MRGAHDDATPNANAVMISNLAALHLLTGKAEYLARAHAIPEAFAADLGKNPLGHCGLLASTFDLIAPQHVVVIQTADADASANLARAMFRLSLPGAVLQIVDETGLPSQRPPRRQDHSRRPTHRLRLPRPDVLAAGDGARCVGPSLEGFSCKVRQLISLSYLDSI